MTPRAGDPDCGSAERLVLAGMLTTLAVVIVWARAAWWAAGLAGLATAPLWLWAWREFFRRERAGRHARALRAIGSLERSMGIRPDAIDVPAWQAELDLPLFRRDDAGGMVLPEGMKMRTINANGQLIDYVTFDGDAVRQSGDA